MPALLIKLDIARAFDSVSWEFILELLQWLGFSARWRDWIALLLSTTSSSFLLNGTPGQAIKHRRCFLQGDSLSPLLFILAIDPLHHMIARAAKTGILAPLPGWKLKLWVSLYADDAVIFANPDREEVDKLMAIINLFGDASGLHLNAEKSTVTPIRCEEINLQDVLCNFGGKIAAFPIKYLGLLVILGRTRLVHLQFILDRIKARLAGWKGRMLSIAGRRVLVRSVLTAIPTFALFVIRAPKKLFKDVDIVRRRFLWAKDEELAGGRCKVKWSKVCSPTDCGGL